MAFAYDTYTNPSKNNGVLRATLTQHFPSRLMYAGFKRIAPQQDPGMELTSLALLRWGCLMQERVLKAPNVNKLCLPI